jgi:hypothetical protein
VEGHQGKYNGRNDGIHDIDLVKWLRPEAASKQLWHELTHAKQWERDPKRWEAYMRDYDRQYDKNPQGYRNHPWEVEAIGNAEAHPFSLVHGGEKIAAGSARVLYNKFNPENTHPPTDADRTASLPFTYDPEANVVHLGPPNSYHWELIQRTPELRAQYPMDQAYQQFSGMLVPKHLHGRMTWPDKHTDFMGLTNDNAHHRDTVNAALGATPKPQQDWGSVFANTNNEGQHGVPAHTRRTTSEEAGSLRGAHQQEEAVGSVSGPLWAVLEAGAAGPHDG